MHGAELLVSVLIAHRDRTQQKIAVPAYVLGKCLHGDVYSVRKGVKVHARRPGVVEDYHGPGTVRDFHDCRNILHLHGDRARALAPHQACVLTKI